MTGKWWYALLVAVPGWLAAASGCSEEREDQFIRLGSRGVAVAELRSYLKVYGYLQGEGPGADPMIFDEQVEQALRQFQNWHGLPEDGTLNPSTEELMKQPRCQLPDVVAMEASAIKQGASARFTLSGKRWNPNTSIPYSVSLVHSANNPPAALLLNGVDAAIQAWRPAFNAGGLSASLSLYLVSGTGDIRFLSAPIDGPGKMLAWAPFPPGGDVVFDSEETWTGDPARPGTDFIAVAVHETGHALGLAHSSDRNAVMYPYIVNGRRSPTDDDQRGLRAMYLNTDPSQAVQFCRGKNVLLWDPVIGATHYELYRSNAADFTAPQLVYSGRSGMFEVDVPLGTTWYFRSRACKDAFCTDLGEQVSPAYDSRPCMP